MCMGGYMPNFDNVSAQLKSIPRRERRNPTYTRDVAPNITWSVDLNGNLTATVDWAAYYALRRGWPTDDDITELFDNETVAVRR